MALNEIQRQNYLKTMGIQSYFPRVKLPAAKPSVQCEWPETITVSEPNVTLSTGLYVKKKDVSIELVAEESTSVPISPSSILNKLNLEKEPVPERLIAEKVSEKSPLNVNSEVHFQLVFISVNDQLSILNQIPYIGSNKLSINHKNLLMNILKALKLQVDQVEFDDLSFRWPLGEEKHLDKSEAAAKTTLNSYLEQKHASAGFKRLLVMGDMLSNYVNQEEKAWQVINTHSLDEMLTMPLIKRDVWHLLRTIDFTDFS